MTRPWEPQDTPPPDYTDGLVVWDEAKRAFAYSVVNALKNPTQGIHRQAALEWGRILKTLSGLYSEKIWD